MIELLLGAAVIDEIASQNKSKYRCAYKNYTPQDECYHGAWNWHDCGECRRLGRKVSDFEDLE